MTPEDVARQHYFDRRRLSDAVAELARRAWSRMNPANLDSSWQAAAPELLVSLAGAQLAAARAADSYTAEVLEEDGPSAVNPAAFAGVASDGRPLDSLLRNPITVVKMAIAGQVGQAMASEAMLAGRPGLNIDQAMAAGYANLDMLVRTQLADAGRTADQVALVAHPAAEGYTRVLVGKSCSRCIVLAGRWYRWNAGFRRHPRCDCSHQPGRGPAEGFQADPRHAFEAMSRAEQDKTFTINGAQAIRDGSDIGRVVNARRGMATAGETRTRVRADGLVVNERIRRQATTRVAGRDVFTTTEAAGRKPRLMPEEIYRIAGNDRDEARRLLRNNGYLTDVRPRIARPAAPKGVRPAPVREPIMQVPKQRVPAPKTAPTPKPTPALTAPKVPSSRVTGSDRVTEMGRNAHLLQTSVRGSKWDRTLGNMAHRQGFDALPRVGNAAAVDAAVRSGWIETWRGVSGGAAAINRDLRYGEFQPGTGLYGNGIYTSVRRETAEAFRGVNIRKPLPSDLEPDSMLRIAIDPAARIVDYDDLLKEWKAWLRTQPKLVGSEGSFHASPDDPKGTTKLMGSDIARFATARGYDVIRVRNNNGKWADGAYNYRKGETRADQYNVLNRSVLLIQEAGTL